MRRIQGDFPGTGLKFCKTPEIESQDVLDMISFHGENFRFAGSNPLEDQRLRQLFLDVSGKTDVGLCVSRLGNADTTLAMDLIFLRGNRLYGYLTAFNCEHARYSPGSCLLTDRLDLLAEKEGIEVLDFLCGSEPYKYRFAQGEYFVKAARLVPRTVAGGFKITMLRARQLIRSLGKKVLLALKLKR